MHPGLFKLYTGSSNTILNDHGLKIENIEHDQSNGRVFITVKDCNYAIMIYDGYGNSELFTKYTVDGEYKPLKTQLAGYVTYVIKTLVKRHRYWQSRK